MTVKQLLTGFTFGSALAKEYTGKQVCVFPSGAMTDVQQRWALAYKQISANGGTIVEDGIQLEAVRGKSKDGIAGTALILKSVHVPLTEAIDLSEFLEADNAYRTRRANEKAEYLASKSLVSNEDTTW